MKNHFYSLSTQTNESFLIKILSAAGKFARVERKNEENFDAAHARFSSFSPGSVCFGVPQWNSTKQIFKNFTPSGNFNQLIFLNRLLEGKNRKKIFPRSEKSIHRSFLSFSQL
jgi:hypothetical protein